MEERHREILQSNHVFLLKGVTYTHINSELVEKRVISKDDDEEIESKANNKKRMTALLALLPRQGPSAFSKFIESLSESDTDYQHVVTKLLGDAGELVEKMNDEEYKNWLKCQYGLSIVKEGVNEFVMNTSHGFHAKLKQRGLQKCSADCANKESGKSALCQKCPYCFWRKEIKQFAKDPGGLTWRNSSPSGWYDYHWEVSKVYMSYLGDEATRKASAEDCDTSALLQLMSRNKHFIEIMEKSSPDSIKHIREVLDCRNSLMHSKDKRLSERELFKYIDCFILVVGHSAVSTSKTDKFNSDLEKLKHLKIDVTSKEWQLRESQFEREQADFLKLNERLTDIEQRLQAAGI